MKMTLTEQVVEHIKMTLTQQVVEHGVVVTDYTGDTVTCQPGSVNAGIRSAHNLYKARQHACCLILVIPV